MNLAQMGVKYTEDRQGRPKLISLKPQEQEAALKSSKRQDAHRRWQMKQSAKDKAAAKKAA